MVTNTHDGSDFTAVTQLGDVNAPRLATTPDVSAHTTEVVNTSTLSRDELFALLYDELRHLARSRLRTVGGRTYLDTTSLVHDAFARLSQTQSEKFASKGQFMAYCGRVMRSVIIDLVRSYQAECRRDGEAAFTLNTEIMQDVMQSDEGADDVLRIHDALERLRAVDERLETIVEMRFFAGFNEIETANALQISERTVTRLWARARGLLRVMLTE
jgi:RNA polymerase sigma factor (TIGR02999 family)